MVAPLLLVAAVVSILSRQAFALRTGSAALRLRFSSFNRINHAAATVTSPLQKQQRFSVSLRSTSAPEQSSADGKFDVSAWLNPNTRGGVIVWSFLLILIPVAFYEYFVSTGLEETTVGAYVGAIFVLLSNLLWASTYVFRVANKDMTYAKQLRDYENAVLQKRLEELADDEIDALMKEIEDEDAKST